MERIKGGEKGNVEGNKREMYICVYILYANIPYNCNVSYLFEILGFVYLFLCSSLYYVIVFMYECVICVGKACVAFCENGVFK